MGKPEWGAHCNYVMANKVHIEAGFAMVCCSVRVAPLVTHVHTWLSLIMSLCMPPTWSVLNHCAKILPLVSSVLCLSLSVVEVASTSLHASFMLTLHSGSSPSILSSTGPKWTWMFKYWKLLIKFGVSSHKQASKHTHRADKRIGRGGGGGEGGP